MLPCLRSLIFRKLSYLKGFCFAKEGFVKNMKIIRLRIETEEGGERGAILKAPQV